MNKIGGTLTNWIFTIGTILLFVVILQSQVLDTMNERYNQTFSTGLNTSGINDLNSLKTTLDSEIEGAEVESTADGLTLKSAGTVGKGTYKTIIRFINGTFIKTLVIDILDFPEVVANILIVLIWISLILIIIYIFMKVVP
jgi:hypothetical protein